MSSTPLPRVSPDLPAARQYVQQGRLLEAEAAYRRVLADNPALTEALRFVANAALAHGNAGEAVQLLNRAADADRGNVGILLELGVAYRTGQRYDAAGAVLQQAIARGEPPQRAVARLLLGTVLEADARPDQALLNYFRAVLEAQAMGRWLSDATTEPDLRDLVRHAMAFVATGRRRACDAALDVVRKRAGATPVPRIESAVSAYLRERGARSDDPAQRPTFVNIPGLNAQRFVALPPDLAWFPECARALCGLADEASACAHADTAAPDKSAFSLDRLMGDAKPAAAVDAPSATVPLLQRGEVRGSASMRAPGLLAALDRVPLVRIPGSGPDAGVISVAPGQGSPTRFGRSNAWLAATILTHGSAPVEVTVGGQPRIIAAGDAVVFDPTFGYAYRGTDGGEALAVTFEFWHPDLSADERAAMAEVTAVAVEFDRQMEDLR